MTEPGSGSDRVARAGIITAASRGIGQAIAAALIARGDRVVITGRDPQRLAAAVAELGSPEQVIGVPGKAHDDEHQQRAVTAALTTFGRIDYLVNNVGANPVFAPLLEVPTEAIRKIMEINLISALAWTRRVHQAWQGEHGGSVVNVASVAGLAPAAGIGAYGISKAALLHLTRQLALELAPTVRVNAVAPAVVKTRFAEALYSGREEEAGAAYPLGRLGEPTDVAAAVAYLLSDEAAWVTGQTMVLDGGAGLAGRLG
ncbi:SDR family oxidoreductase [Natronosporangium hydrolyticum]|uniref:SDR family oxidoreductase n=1 Tax=Natronosporangium hydrolyticum TaxID=2811111 RepID=A0A895Y5Q8_9ACTN|nr:SDR family oxidoreductase [Natronosporangium hydrolyticum]QSB12731.1 SDR family oxidoreductase [Natronosporangium hydrolyticum]